MARRRKAEVVSAPVVVGIDNRTIGDLHRELCAALYIDRETLHAHFMRILDDRPIEAFKILVSLVPKQIVVSDKADLPPLVKDIQAAMVEYQGGMRGRGAK